MDASLAFALCRYFLFGAERLINWANPVFFWLVIVLVCTAATNVADLIYDFRGNYDTRFAVGLPICGGKWKLFGVNIHSQFLILHHSFTPWLYF